MADSADVSGHSDTPSEVTSTRPAGVWREDYFFPDGSRPVTAVDEHGILRGFYCMTEEDDPVAVHEHLAALLGGNVRTNLELVE